MMTLIFGGWEVGVGGRMRRGQDLFRLELFGFKYQSREIFWVIFFFRTPPVFEKVGGH